MKKNEIYLMPLFIFTLILFSFNLFSQANANNQKSNNEENVVLSMVVNSLPCTVEGRCEGYFCSASIECGCDETPNCSCSWATCKCDCEKKGRIGVILYPEYVDVMKSLKLLISNSSSLELENVLSDINLVLQSIDDENYSDFIYNSQKLYDDVHSLVDSNNKDLINNWFKLQNIDDEI